MFPQPNPILKKKKKKKILLGNLFQQELNLRKFIILLLKVVTKQITFKLKLFNYYFKKLEKEMNRYNYKIKV